MWLRQGAPLGILREIDTCGVFPPSADNQESMSPSTLQTALGGWSNYKSAEDSPEVVDQLLAEQESK